PPLPRCPARQGEIGAESARRRGRRRPPRRNRRPTGMAVRAGGSDNSPQGAMSPLFPLSPLFLQEANRNSIQSPSKPEFPPTLGGPLSHLPWSLYWNHIG